MNTTIIRRISGDGRTEEKEIYELAEEDKNKYSLFGQQATGISMMHCVMLAAKYEDNFWHRVYGYRLIQSEFNTMLPAAVRKIDPTLERYITVCFYERLAKRKLPTPE